MSRLCFACPRKSATRCAISVGCWPSSMSVRVEIIGGIMDFADVLRRRKAVRNYVEEPIPRETLERIVARGRRVPSGGFSQGLRLIVVTDQDTRAKIAELSDEHEYVAMGFDPWISRAPAHIVIGTREEDYHDRYRQPDKLTEDGTEIHWPVPYWHVDAGA